MHYPQPLLPAQGLAVRNKARVARAVRLRKHPGRLVNGKQMSILKEKQRTEAAALVIHITSDGEATASPSAAVPSATAISASESDGKR